MTQRRKKTAITVLCTAVLCFAAIFSPRLGFIGTRERKAYAENFTSQTRVVGYLPTWSYWGYDKIDFTALTHINIAFCNADANGKISCDIPDSDLTAIIEKAHGKDVKVLAALGGGGQSDGYRNLISTSAKIQTLNKNIAAFCEKYGLDGVDLDIELGGSDGVWKYYGEWVQTLRAVCDDRGWLLSAATAGWVAEKVTKETFELFDFLNVMAYDNDSQGSDSHSSYEFSVECLNYFHTRKQIPKEKLVLGVPFYGRGYDDSGNLDWSVYVSFSDLVKQDEKNYENDSYNGVAYTGAATMREKCKLGKEYGGIMIWEITLDAEGEYSLLGVIKEELSQSLDSDSNSGDESDVSKKKNPPWILISGIVILSVFAASMLAVILVKKKRPKK